MNRPMLQGCVLINACDRKMLIWRSGSLRLWPIRYENLLIPQFHNTEELRQFYFFEF
jgi:hypothetical protein